MGIWSWARSVIADRPVEDPVPVFLERSADGEGYVFRLGLRAGFGGDQTARIAVHRRVNPAPHPVLKEIHYCEVAGRTLEAANVYALQEKVARLLDSIAPARALPLCYFRVPAADYEIAAYEDGGAITAPVIGGPKFKARDLAGIRRDVCRYLTSAGYVSDDEEVAVGVLRPRDLRLVAPAAVFCSYAERAVWLPSVEGISADGPVVGVLGRSAALGPERRRSGGGPATGASAPAAPDVVALLRFLQSETRHSRAVLDPQTLYASRVRPEIWRDAEERSEDAGRTLVAHLSDDEASVLELTIRRTGAGDVAVALEHSGINVFLAPDEDALAGVVARYLSAQGFLRFREAVELHRPAAPRPERLDPDSIFSRPPAGWRVTDRATYDDLEEVHRA